MLVALLLPLLPAGALGFEVVYSENVGRYPYDDLVLGSDGSFYGTTYQGGTSGNGTVFKVTASGTLTTLVSFNGTDGRYPEAGLVEGSDGAFYGTTSRGGASDHGTVFKITTAGVHHVLHSFNTPSGRYPQARLILGSDGNFYGTTYQGGASGSNGTVFRITTAGVHSVLHNFNNNNGRYPWAGLVEGSDGVFYGTTANGGTSGNGTVFKITKAGVHSLLHSFDGSAAISPQSTPIIGSDGNLYGTADLMVVWRLSPPQQKFDNAMTAAGLSGGNAIANATPRQDAMANLLKYAFNMDLTAPDRRTMIPGSGIAGLPVITVPSPGVMRMEYVRRVGSGLIYTPKKRGALDAGTWVPLTAPPVVTPINANWERVHHDEAFNPVTVDSLFGSVEVTLP